MKVDLRIDPRNAVGLLRHAPEVFRPALDAAMRNLGKSIMDDQARQMRGRPGLQRRSGTLARSRFATVVPANDSRTLSCGFAGVPYAKIHEEGGTVRATKSKWLTIPVGPALNAAGVAKGPARSFPNLQLLIPKGLGRSPMLGIWKASGNILTDDQVAERQANKNVYQGVNFNFNTGKARASLFIPYFILKKSVKIPARLGFFDNWKSWFANGRAGKGLNLAVARQVRLLNGGARNASK